MKKVLISVLILLLLAVAGVALAPFLVDWNAYRADFSRAIAEATGREVAIEGDLKLSLLPSPSISASTISIGNFDGGQAPYLARIGELHLRLALGPLLGGRVAIDSLLLVDPSFNLETAGDGRENWNMQAGSQERGSKSAAGSFSFDTVSIRNGSVLWITPGSENRNLERIDAKLSADGPKGPFRVKGAAVFGNIPFAATVNLGSPGADGASSFSAAFEIAGDKGRVLASGVLVRENQQGRGTVSASSPDAALFAAAVMGESAPSIPALPVALDSTFDATASRISLSKVVVRYGEMHGEGAAALDIDERPTLSARLEIRSADLDVLAARTVPPQGGTAAGRNARPEQEARLPEGFDARIDMSARAIRWRDGIVRSAETSLQLTDGILHVEKLAADLPGGTRASFSGSARNTDSGIRLDGSLAAVSDNLRAALVWTGVSDRGLPPGQMRSLSYTSNLTITGEAVSLANITARLDTTRLAGAATIARRSRPSFGLRLDVDSVNLDSYLPNDSDSSGESKNGGEDSLSFLAGFDANINLTADKLIWRRKTFRRLALDGRLFNGDVVLRKLAVADFGETAVTARGKIDRAASRPLVDMELSLDGRSAEAFAGELGLKPNGAVQKLGRFDLTLKASGAANDLDIKGLLNIAEGKIEAQGTLKGLRSDEFTWDLDVNTLHPDGARILMLAQPDRKWGKVGSLSTTFRTEGNLAKWTVTDLRGTLDEMAIAGRLKAVKSKRGRAYAADISVGVANLGRLLPVEPERIATTPRPRGSARWSREPFDLSGLRDAQVALTLRAERLIRGDFELEKADLAASIAGGVITVPRLSAEMAGGTLEAVGRIDATGNSASVTATIAARNVPARALLETVAGFDRLEGPVSFDFELQSAGANMFEAISSLAGNGKLSGQVQGRLSDEERAKAGAAGIVGFILGNKISEVGTTGDAVSRLIHAFANSRARLSGDVAISKGVARTENLLLEGRGATALSIGSADLPNWRIDSKTTMQREQDGTEPYMVIGLKGPIDEPNVRISGSVIRGVTRESAPPLAAPVIPVDPVTPNDPDQQPQPEQLLLDLLKNLGR